jgi:hypothetical protein
MSVSSLQLQVIPHPTLVPQLQRSSRASDLKLSHTLHAAQVWHRLTAGCLQHSRNISKELISHVIKEFKQLWENGFKYSLNISTVTCLRNLFSAGSIVLNERETMWKNEV